MVCRGMKEHSLCEKLKVVQLLEHSVRIRECQKVEVGESAHERGHMQEFGLMLSIIEGEGTKKLGLYFSKTSSSDRMKAGITVQWKMR